MYLLHEGERKVKSVLLDSQQKGKKMMMTVKTRGSQVGSPAAGGGEVRGEGGET